MARSAYLALIVLLVGFACAFAPSQIQIQKRSLEEHIQEVIGPDPVDCGTIPRGRVPRETFDTPLACARDAVAKGRAFRLVQWFVGVDSEVAHGFQVLCFRGR